MEFIKKYKAEIICGVIFALLYFFLRIYHILNLPIFTDEAIYVRWAQIAKQDANWRFISLTDGKQPMFVWIAMVFMRFIKDPLLAGRFVSVCAGFGTVIGLYVLTREVFKNRAIGILAAFLYVIFPFGLVYDRMALYESLVTMFVVWSLYFEILLARYVRLDIAFATALVLGGAVLTKTTGFISLYAQPALLLLFNFNRKDWRKKLVEWIGCVVLVFILTYAYYSILRLSPFFHIIDEKNTTFYYPFSQWVMHPFTFFLGNLRGMFNWFSVYMTYPVILLILASFVISLKFLKEKVILFIWFLVPFIIFAFIGKVLYPRYILPMVITLLPMAAYTLYELYIKTKKVWVPILIGVLCLLLYVRADYFILNDFPHAPIPDSDLNQYSNDWPAGGGVKEAVAFFSKQAESHKIYIGTQGTFGLLPFAFEIYLVNNPNVTIKGIWPIDNTMPQELVDAAKKMPTYVVFYQPCLQCGLPGDAPLTWPLKKIYTYEKTIGNRFLSIYQVQ